MALLGATEEPAILDGYGPIPPSMARDLIANGAESFHRVLIDPRDGAPLEIGRKNYRLTPAMRHWLRLRDAKCTFPACNNNTLDNDADHIHPWHHGGTTGINNLNQLCPKHHHLKHNTTWTPTTATKNHPPGWLSPTGRYYPAEHPDHEPPTWPTTWTQQHPTPNTPQHQAPETPAPERQQHQAPEQHAQEALPPEQHTPEPCAPKHSEPPNPQTSRPTAGDPHAPALHVPEQSASWPEAQTGFRTGEALGRSTSTETPGSTPPRPAARPLEFKPARDPGSAPTLVWAPDATGPVPHFVPQIPKISRHHRRRRWHKELSPCEAAVQQCLDSPGK